LCKKRGENEAMAANYPFRMTLSYQNFICLVSAFYQPHRRRFYIGHSQHRCRLQKASYFGARPRPGDLFVGASKRPKYILVTAMMMCAHGVSLAAFWWWRSGFGFSSDRVSLSVTQISLFVSMHDLQFASRRKTKEFNQDLQMERSKIVDGIRRKVVNLLARYSSENDYAVIFDSSAQDSLIVYKSTNIELTPEIIRLYDKTFPADIR
jgi:hypothetical protein